MEKKSRNRLKIEDMYIKSSSFFLLLFILFFVTACNNTPPTETSQKQPVIPIKVKPGTVVSKVPCYTDSTKSYAVYLPSDYTPKHTFPVVFFFDAHARGDLVVKKYKNVAQEFGFILAVSNNSKNGQTNNLMNKILYNFMQDVEERFSVDPLQIYTAGFSGGARVAAGIGLFNKNVAGTIGLEAGFPAVQQIPDMHLTWVGVVGNTDFNYLEMKNLAKQLNAMGMQNLLLVYPGKHELPPPTIFKKAYEFLLLSAMRKQTVPINQALIDTVKNQYDQIRLLAQKKDDCIQQLEADKDLVKNLEGLTDISQYLSEIKKLSANHDCQLRQKEIAALVETEIFYQQKFDRSMNTENSGWWKEQIEEIYRKKNVTRDNRVKLMYQRLLNYLSLTSYLYANNSLKNGQMEATSKFLMIYQMVDPDNPEVYFMKAEYYAVQNHDDKAIQSLQDAVDHGFNDMSRIKNNKYFLNLKSSSQFAKILEKTKSMKQAD
ncbi:MAG: hypothetical protein JXR65_02290 [Bacteroidales bacterium]|nr:hypothetical protein [Bacteroidales bacterium]